MSLLSFVVGLMIAWHFPQPFWVSFLVNLVKEKFFKKK